MPRNLPAYLGVKGTEKSCSEQCFPNLSGLRALAGSLTSMDSHYLQNALWRPCPNISSEAAKCMISFHSHVPFCRT